MKRQSTTDRGSSSNRELIVDNNDQPDEYAMQSGGGRLYPSTQQSVRTFRQVEYSRLQRPITLPRWARNSYRSEQMPSVPQLAPEIRVLPMDELMLYEGGEEDPQADANGGGEVDLDGQVDVCALEDGEEPEETIETEEATPTVKQMKIQPPSVKVENEEEPNSARYRILRKTGNETFAARTKRDAAKKNDDVVLGYDDASGELVQEEVEVMDEHGANNPCNVVYTSAPMTINRRATFNDPRSVVNLNELYEEMFRYAPAMSIDAFNDIFGTESSMSYPLNVKSLMANVKNASAEQNAKMIAAMAMQINFMKREINKMREDIVDTRSATMMRQNYGITGRTFDLNAQVSQPWYIHDNPPLKAVDLVKTARDVSLRIGRKNLKTRDIITRYVRAVFDQMIPLENIREFTVRDRPSTRGNVTDIGIQAKDQIIGIVLDLMGLYDVELLNNHSRVDRANFSDFVNQAMKTVMYDMRRISPKSRKQPRPSSVDDQELIEEE